MKAYQQVEKLAEVLFLLAYSCSWRGWELRVGHGLAALAFELARIHQQQVLRSTQSVHVPCFRCRWCCRSLDAAIQGKVCKHCKVTSSALPPLGYVGAWRLEQCLWHMAALEHLA